MNRCAIVAGCASIVVLLGSVSALAESSGLSRQTVPGPAAFDEKARALESLSANAQAAREQARLLIKGPAAALYRMKAVELDELIERLSSAEARMAKRGNPSLEPSRPEFTDERLYAIEFLKAYAEAARNEVRSLRRGPAVTLYRMKVVELDELIDRLRKGDAVSYQEVEDAMRLPAVIISGPP